MTTRELLVPKYSKRRKGTKLKSIAGVTIHNTGNTSKGADADANARYQKNSCNEAVNGWHWTVDENEAVLSIPEDEVAEHAGKRKYNDTTVGIEICENKDGDLLRATDNGAQLAAQVLKRQGFKKAIWKQNIFQHHDASGKNCPSRIRANEPYSWDEFVKRVNAYMNGTISSIETNKPSAPTVKPSQPLVDVSSGEPLPNGTLYYQLRTKERAYFRSAPDKSTSVNIITTLNVNTNVKYRGEAGEYYKVSVVGGSGRIGYVAKKLLTPDWTGSQISVKVLQKALKVTPDGLYGLATAKAVEAVQRANSLTVDGIYGPNTKKALQKR